MYTFLIQPYEFACCTQSPYLADLWILEVLLDDGCRQCVHVSCAHALGVCKCWLLVENVQCTDCNLLVPKLVGLRVSEGVHDLPGRREDSCSEAGAFLSLHMHGEKGH
jgi:hypothetical protein